MIQPQKRDSAVHQKLPAVTARSSVQKLIFSSHYSHAKSYLRLMMNTALTLVTSLLVTSLAAQSNEEMKNLTLANSLQQNTGVKDAMLLSVDDIAKLNPHIILDNIIGGSYCPSDGFITPMNILSGYINSCLKNGVNFLNGTKVTGIKTSHAKIEFIETSNGSYYGDIIINAAGAFAGPLALLAGETLPVKHSKRQVCRIKEPGTLPPLTPMTIWVHSGFHFRMRDDHLILLHPCEPKDNNNYNTDIEDNWLNNVFEIAKDKIPAIKNCTVDNAASWAGLYEMSPDNNLTLGKSQNLENFYYANGSSGHGMMRLTCHWRTSCKYHLR